jgi:hypothetical protein
MVVGVDHCLMDDPSELTKDFKPPFHVAATI